MTNRNMYVPQDFQKMCKQAERDREAKKLVALLERVKRQIAERANPASQADLQKRPATTATPDAALLRLLSRPVPSER